MIPGETPCFFPMESLFQNNGENRQQSVADAPLGYHDVSNGMMMMKRSMSFSGVDLSSPDQELHMDDDVSEDGGGPLGEKKRRLSSEQVKALEKSFELGTKLDPERKLQLARTLGLQPRQVAIWFQNRRARWKTKTLEKDYDKSRKQLELLKAENEVLRAQNKQYQVELMALKSRESGGFGTINLNKDNEGSWSNGSESSADVNLGINSGLQQGNGHVFSPAGMEQPAVAHLLQPPRMDESTSDVGGGLSNMFTSVQEHPSFWPWPEHPNFR